MRLLLLLLVALSWSFPAWAQDAAPPAAPAAEAASFTTRLDELWKTRDTADSVKLNDDVIRDGLRAFPADYEILWRAARIRWWQADGLSNSAAGGHHYRSRP